MDATARALSISDQTFDQEVLQSDLPVLVDFWAEWCGPCRTVGPTVEALADEYQGLVKVTKLNVDENPEVVMQYGIRGIPTLMVFREGAVKETLLGVRPKDALAEMLNRNLH